MQTEDFTVRRITNLFSVLCDLMGIFSHVTGEVGRGEGGQGGGRGRRKGGGIRISNFALLLAVFK